MEQQKEKLLIFAYACEPNEGSEPGVGWNWSVELQKYFDVTVITRSNNQTKIENYEKNTGVRFLYCDAPEFFKSFKRGQKGLHLYYLMWQITAFKYAKRIFAKTRFDYVMSLTFGNMWLPTFAHRLDAKFIWGPLGGGEGVPKVWINKMSFKQKLFEVIRNINKKIPFTNPWFYQICKKSDLIIVRTNDSLECIPQKYKDKCIVCIETGISEEDIKSYLDVHSVKEKKTIDFICSGKMVPYKQFDIAIEAFAKICSDTNIGVLSIVGDGPEMGRLKSIVKKKGIDNKVIFHGQVPREDAMDLMNKADVVLLPSAREGGSWIMFEAMLMRKPVICFDTSGMHVIETKDTAVLLPISKYDDAVVSFAKAMYMFVNHTKVHAMGEAAFCRVSNELKWSDHTNKMISSLKGECNK